MLECFSNTTYKSCLEHELEKNLFYSSVFILKSRKFTIIGLKCCQSIDQIFIAEKYLQ